MCMCRCVCLFDVNTLNCLMYVQDMGKILLLSVGSIQRNLDRLLCEAQLVLTEEMHLHLVVENCKRRGKSLLRICLHCESAVSPASSSLVTLSHTCESSHGLASIPYTTT